MTSPVRLIAQYFPQLHAIPENDRWWGPGFTDWVNVKKAEALYDGHYQPRVPAGGDYYDQSQVEVIRRQAEMAKAHGVYAFCHYHYWFDGKALLHKPTDLLLANKDIDIKFCLAWANETWSRRWDGLDHEILIQQTHPPTMESWSRHFERLIPAWMDERAVRVNGKPMFLIYRSERIPSLGSMFDYWQSRARAYGIEGIHFVNIVQSYFPHWSVLKHFDASMLFEPFFANGSLPPGPPPPKVPLWRRAGGAVLDKFPAPIREPIQNITQQASRPRRIDYEQIWAQIVDAEPIRHMSVYPGSYVDWDNTARYKRRATVFTGASPERFEFWMKQLVEKVAKAQPAEPFIFLNAWNEWAESAYLEPDERYGMRYLQALKNALGAHAET